MTVFKIHIHFILYRHLILYFFVNPRSPFWTHQKSLLVTLGAEVDARTFRTKGQHVFRLGKMGMETGEWLVNFKCISFFFSFNSFNSFMYKNPEVDKIVTWFLEVSYSIYSRITSSLSIIIYIQYFGLPLKIACGVSLGQFLWDAPHMLIHTGHHVLICAYANHCYLAFRFSVTQ